MHHDIWPDLTATDHATADISATEPASLCVWCQYAIEGVPVNGFYCSRVCVESAREAAGLPPDPGQVAREAAEYRLAYADAVRVLLSDVRAAQAERGAA